MNLIHISYGEKSEKMQKTPQKLLLQKIWFGKIENMRDIFSETTGQ